MITELVDPLDFRTREDGLMKLKEAVNVRDQDGLGKHQYDEMNQTCCDIANKLKGMGASVREILAIWDPLPMEIEIYYNPAWA